MYHNCRLSRTTAAISQFCSDIHVCNDVTAHIIQTVQQCNFTRMLTICRQCRTQCIKLNDGTVVDNFIFTHFSAQQNSVHATLFWTILNLNWINQTSMVPYGCKLRVTGHMCVNNLPKVAAWQCSSGRRWICNLLIASPSWLCYVWHDVQLQLRGWTYNEPARRGLVA